jgi:hypothetical protein
MKGAAPLSHPDRSVQQGGAPSLELEPRLFMASGTSTVAGESSEGAIGTIRFSSYWIAHRFPRGKSHKPLILRRRCSLDSPPACGLTRFLNRGPTGFSHFLRHDVLFRRQGVDASAPRLGWRPLPIRACMVTPSAVQPTANGSAMQIR